MPESKVAFAQGHCFPGKIKSGKYAVIIYIVYYKIPVTQNVNQYIILLIVLHAKPI